MESCFLWGALILSGIIMAVYYFKSKRPVRNLFFGVVSGAAGLLLVHYLGSYIGISLPLSGISIAASLILGLPGVIMLVLINIMI